MMLFRLTRFGLLAALVAAAPPAFAAELTPLSTSFTSAGFEELARKDGVVVYKDNKSPVIRVAADGPLNAPPEVAQRVLLDYERQKGKVQRVSESKILARGKWGLMVYQRINLPVISDRDFTLHVWSGKKNGVYWIKYRAVDKRGPPPRSGIERVTDHEGSWQLAPADGGKTTRARFQVKIDLAGMLPRWLAKTGAGKELPSMYADMNRLLPKSSPKKSAVGAPKQAPSP